MAIAQKLSMSSPNQLIFTLSAVVDVNPKNGIAFKLVRSFGITEFKLVPLVFMYALMLLINS